MCLPPCEAADVVLPDEPDGRVEAAAPVPADADSRPTGGAGASGVECAAMVGMEGTADEGATSCERNI